MTTTPAAVADTDATDSTADLLPADVAAALAVLQAADSALGPQLARGTSDPAAIDGLLQSTSEEVLIALGANWHLQPAHVTALLCHRSKAVRTSALQLCPWESLVTALATEPGLAEAVMDDAKLRDALALRYRYMDEDVRARLAAALADLPRRSMTLRLQPALYLDARAASISGGNPMSETVRAALAAGLPAACRPDVPADVPADGGGRS